MIRETMIDPAQLRRCIRGSARLDDRGLARRLARIAEKIRALEDKRRAIIDRYAAEQIAGDEYIAANRALDGDLERLVRKKAEIVAEFRSPQQPEFLDASIRQFCATAHTRFLACQDVETKRQFLLDHVERVIHHRYKVALTGFVPVQSSSGETKVQFQIRGEIDIAGARRSG